MASLGEPAPQCFPVSLRVSMKWFPRLEIRITRHPEAWTWHPNIRHRRTRNSGREDLHLIPSSISLLKHSRGARQSTRQGQPGSPPDFNVNFYSRFPAAHAAAAMEVNEKTLLLRCGEANEQVIVENSRRPGLKSAIPIVICSIFTTLLIIFFFTWTKAPALQWSSCGRLDGHDVQCARLEVPMDHFSNSTSPTAGKTFSLALTRLVGKNATKSLLVNPGGPGGSGGEFVFRRGEQLNKIVGDGHDIVSFDPRGVNQSSPKAACFASDIDRTVDRALAPIDPWTQSGDFYAYHNNLAQACHDIMGEAGAYFNTPQTAADMNSILDDVGQEKMYYWGFSYGTILGQTYAQMFPERVERLIIDGVADQEPWYNLEIPDTDAFNSTDSVFDGFIDECFKAGKACPLAAGFTTAAELQTNLTTSIMSLYHDPISVYINASLHGELRYFDVAWDGIFPSLYKPASWPQLAENLSAFVHGNYSVPFLAWSLPERAWDDTFEGNLVIGQSDLVPIDQLTRVKKTRLEIMAAAEIYHKTSAIAGDTGVEALFETEAWRYARTHSFAPAKHVKTAHPLLILSTTLDPICPLISAQKANKVYEGSVLLEQKSMGHCTGSMASKCTAKHVREYLDTGKLPKAGTTCEIDAPYFPDPKSHSGVLRGSAEDVELADALMAMANDPPWSISAIRRRAR